MTTDQPLLKYGRLEMVTIDSL